MVSSFDDFHAMLQERSFDILPLSETWLKDDVNLLEYVQIPGYKFSYKNRNERTGGGVGLYIKDSIEYKVRHDLNTIDERIEHLRIECKGNNCNKNYLVAALYQPNSDEKKKRILIGKFDSLLSIINRIWNKTVIITGHTNIDNQLHLNDTKKSLKPTTLSSTLLYQRVKELKSLIISSQMYKRIN